MSARRGKANQEGETNGVRFVKVGTARALWTLRADTSPEPGERVVPLSAQTIGRAGIGADEPGCVNHGRDAGRELEDQPHGGALLSRCDGGTCHCTLPVDIIYPRPCRTGASVRKSHNPLTCKSELKVSFGVENRTLPRKVVHYAGDIQDHCGSPKIARREDAETEVELRFHREMEAEPPKRKSAANGPADRAAPGT